MPICCIGAPAIMLPGDMPTIMPPGDMMPPVVCMACCCGIMPRDGMFSDGPPIGGSPMICVRGPVIMLVGCMMPLYAGMTCCCGMPACNVPGGGIGIPIGYTATPPCGIRTCPGCVAWCVCMVHAHPRDVIRGQSTRWSPW